MVTFLASSGSPECGWGAGGYATAEKMNAPRMLAHSAPLKGAYGPVQEGRCKATWKGNSKLPWRKAGPPNHLDDKVDSDQ